MPATATDRAWMARALNRARLGEIGTYPNPRVGCVIVRDGEILAEGHHAECGGPHAEVAALEALSAPEASLTEATAYVTLEPCSHHGRTPPCSDRLIASGIGRVVVGMQDPDPRVAGSGIDRMRAAGITVDVLEAFAAGRWLNRRFLSSLERGRPWVVLKCAVSADGFMDPPRQPGQQGSLTITEPALRRLTHRWRAEEGAILVGAGTLATDDPALDVRESDGPHPLVVVLDPNGRTSPGSKVYQSGRPTLVIGGPPSLPPHVERVPPKGGTDAFETALIALQERSVRSVLVEGGAETLKTCLASGRWDEFRECRSPRPTGGGLRAVLPGPTEQRCRGWHPFGADTIRYFVHPDSASWAGDAPPPTLSVPLPS